MPVLRMAAALLALVCAPTTVLAQPSVSEVNAFKQRFVAAMAKRDRDAVIRMIRFPATVLIAGAPAVPLADRASALAAYDIVFTPYLRCHVELNGVTVGPDGGALAAGTVRLVHDGDALGITRIVLPPATGPSMPPASPPQQAYFRNGQAQFSGRLYGDGVDTYLVSARKGSRLDARIERFQGRSASIRVIDPANRVLPRPGAEAPRTWAGVLTQEGQYRVEVVRLAPYCDPPFTYLLTMTLR